MYRRFLFKVLGFELGNPIMASNTQSNSVHLKDLAIKGFRGISNLTLPGLGRVNLFAGKNSIGKTTVLEAVQLYASRGEEDVLHEIVRKREEFDYNFLEDSDEVESLNLDALFFGRNPELDDKLHIGPEDGSEKLIISLASEKEIESYTSRGIRNFVSKDTKFLKVVFKRSKRIISGLTNIRRPFRRIRQVSDGNGSAPAIVCHWIGPEILPNPVIARFWDQVALKDEEDIALNAVGMVMDADVERLTMVGDEYSRFRSRRPIVKLGEDAPVPLRSLGDGAVRLFTAALAMTNCVNGFLLIDEVENGIHHSIQQQFWEMVLNTASRYNIQIFATTHSDDCIGGFSRAALESKEDGVLFRLERKNKGIESVRYSENDLEAAAKFQTEVR